MDKKIKKSTKLMNDVAANTGLSPAICFYALKFGITGWAVKPSTEKEYFEFKNQNK